MSQSIIIGGGQCRVVLDGGRTFYSTPVQVGLALLGEYLAEDQAQQNVRTTIAWSDLLSTHGLTVGSHRDTQIILAILPSRMRTITVSGRPTPVNVTFPPVLVGMRMNKGNMQRLVMMLADTRRQTSFGVASPTPVLTPFPYGNVHADTGYVCWGSVTHSGIQTVQALEERFFGSAFNHDLFNARVAGVPEIPAGGGVLPLPPAEVYTTAFPAVIERLWRE